MNNKQPEAKQVINTTKKVELVNAKSTTKNTNPLVVKVDKKLLETKNKQIASARRIQQFWRDGRNRLKWKNTAEGLRNKQKENFASGVLLVMFVLVVATGLIRWYTGISLISIIIVVKYISRKYQILKLKLPMMLLSDRLHYFSSLLQPCLLIVFSYQ